MLLVAYAQKRAKARGECELSVVAVGFVVLLMRDGSIWVSSYSDN